MGVYHQLMQELDATTYRNFLRMDMPTLDELLDMVRAIITHRDT